MTPSLLELKVTPSVCFANKIPDNVTTTNIYWRITLKIFLSGTHNFYEFSPFVFFLLNPNILASFLFCLFHFQRKELQIVFYNEEKMTL